MVYRKDIRLGMIVMYRGIPYKVIDIEDKILIESELFGRKWVGLRDISKKVV